MLNLSSVVEKKARATRLETNAVTRWVPEIEQSDYRSELGVSGH